MPGRPPLAIPCSFGGFTIFNLKDLSLVTVSSSPSYSLEFCLW